MEIMVVVFIISVLAMLAVPAFDRIKIKARTSVIANDFRVFAAAFETYAQEFGKWPAESSAGVVPTGMRGRLKAAAWKRTTPMGGKYNWEKDRLHFGVRYPAAIAISATAGAPLPLDVAQLTDLDRTIDNDNDLFGGSFHLGSASNPLFIVQP